MKIRTFPAMPDYRGRTGLVREVNLIGSKWSLRLMLCRSFGFSLWKNYEQMARFNYPTT